METKQEILKRNVESVAKCNVKYNVTEQGILNAMDEYANLKNNELFNEMQGLYSKKYDDEECGMHFKKIMRVFISNKLI